MNKRDHNPIDPNAIDPREWQAQETALRNERMGADPAADDAQVARYRAIARALRQPPAGGLPSNFAYEIARRAALQPRAAEVDTRLETWLMRALVGTLSVAGAVVAALYGGDWLQATAALLASGGVDAGVGGWVVAVLACVGMTVGFDWARRGYDGSLPRG